jgi:FtsH-binding integral membrane protein
MEIKKAKFYVQVGLTGILLAVSILLICQEPETSNKLKWAYGIIGIVIGYWLK